MSKRKDLALEQLVQVLKRLVEILRLDPNCQWTTIFENDLARGSDLLNRKYEDDELSSLSSSIRHVFGGMGSFNDYSPAIYDPSTGRYTPIAGTEDFEKVTREVFDLSVVLIVRE